MTKQFAIVYLVGFVLAFPLTFLSHSARYNRWSMANLIEAFFVAMLSWIVIVFCYVGMIFKLGKDRYMR